MVYCLHVDDLAVQQYRCQIAGIPLPAENCAAFQAAGQIADLFKGNYDNRFVKVSLSGQLSVFRTRVVENPWPAHNR